MFAEDIVKNFLIGKEIDVFYTFSKVSGFTYSLYVNRHNLTTKEVVKDVKKVVKDVKFCQEYDYTYYLVTFTDGTTCHMQNDRTGE